MAEPREHRKAGIREEKKMKTKGRLDQTLLEMGTDRVLLVVACLALMPCNCISDRFTALIEDSPVIVAWGETAILRCRTSIPYELKEVRWIRIKDGNYSIINIFKDGRDQQRCDLAEYFGRTEVMTEDLARGRVALKVDHVSVSDEGTYRCYLQTDSYFDFGNAEVKVTDALFRKSTDTTALIVLCAIGYVLAAAAVVAFHTWTRHRNRQGASSAVYTEPRYLKVPLDQGFSCVIEQSQVCAVKNTEGSPPVLQSQHTIEQSQMCTVKNTEGSPSVPQSKDTSEQSQVCAMKNTEEGSPVLQ